MNDCVRADGRPSPLPWAAAAPPAPRLPAPAPRPVGPRTLAQRERAAHHAEAALRDGVSSGDVENITLTVADPHGRLAAVTLDAGFVVDEVLKRGYGACSYLFAWDGARRPVDAPSTRPLIDGFGDLVLRPDLASAFVDPLQPGAWQVTCTAHDRDGAPVAVAPRSVLARVLADAEASGLVPAVGIEQEVTFRDDTGRSATAMAMDYALGAAEPIRPVTSEAVAALRAAGLGVESARAECHPGQYEIVLRHRDALAAADDALAQQALVRRVAARHGLRASYLAAEEPGQGSSCHVHMSLSDLDGQPADRLGTDPGPKGPLPPLLGSFLAGVLAAAADLTPIWAPSTNGHTRLRTAPFAPTVVRWAMDRRTAAVRVVGRGPSLRLECRIAGADAHPHLVTAAILAAGLAGVRAGVTPPPAGEVVDDLPSTPWQALERFTGSSLAAELLGADVVAHHAALVEAELIARTDAVTDWDRARGTARS